MSQRKDYISECAEKNKEFFSKYKNKFLLQYVRNRKKEKVGVLVAYNDGDNVKLGWSKCNVKTEPFDREIGIQKALAENRLVNLDDPHEVKDMVIYQLPHSLKNELDNMLARVERYFQ
jgi:hypothetical protein